MSGIKAILDSNVIILASKAEIDVELLLSVYDEFNVSIITFMEVYGFDFASTDEEDLINDLFANIDITEVNINIAKQAIIYRKNKTKKIKLPDAIILATAKFLDAELVTADWDDFVNIDNSVTIRKLDEFKILNVFK
jgi:predicted nucleic acid-binding protein